MSGVRVRARWPVRGSMCQLPVTASLVPGCNRNHIMAPVRPFGTVGFLLILFRTLVLIFYFCLKNIGEK